ncbi:DNRLRE domain-containing protein [Herbidospora sp. NEAU-GS84]|uniref:DNRLRE domain-containing protein n=1 Tax=Herbidospora solisilvae TaxID=2696284 RepID=A0A7C9NZL4_9ACTN|nr:DNRLRE domain-containing protein [Herbidospora solisilvae]NAS21917.1 DNRLRE domain-containing protein [Herbidospora solisilvae]
MSRRSLLRRRALPLLTAVEDVSVASHSDETMPAPPDHELLFLGAFPDSTRGRAYLRFDTSGLPAGVVTSATLRLASYSAPSCGSQTGEGIEVRRVVEPWTDGFLHWGNKPGSTADDAYIAAAGCDVPAEQVEWPVTGIVQEWVDGTSNYGFVLQHPDETLDDGYSRLASAQNTELAQPRLTVTMTVSSAPAFRRVVMQPLWTDESTLIATAPRFVMVMDDPVGGWLSGEFEIEHDPDAPDQGTGPIWGGGYKPGTMANGVKKAVVPAGLLADGWKIRWRVTATSKALVTVSSGWRKATVDAAS